MQRNVFVDESGNLDFSPNGTRYFLLGSVTMDSCDISAELLILRRQLVGRGLDLHNGFHATEDKQAVRNDVFQIIARHDFRFDVTVFEKAKAYPRVRETPVDFYNFAWYFHLKYLLPRVSIGCDHLFVAAATINLKWRRDQANAALGTAVRNTIGTTPFSVAAWASSSEPCLQVADYCCWAVYRKWVNNDDRSYALIADKIESEFDVFRGGAERFY